MRVSRSQLAVLLLCFGRRRRPDAWVLALHPHQPTELGPEPTKAATAVLTAG
ncbi:hypothetical protein [Hymenobacter fastidiosus]|uniref:hypothetical protein n=1 Tax=Hymenobacter fastidiosus TaxID=486264 RepID=UPI0031E7D6E7